METYQYHPTCPNCKKMTILDGIAFILPMSMRVYAECEDCGEVYADVNLLVVLEMCRLMGRCHTTTTGRV